MDEMVAQPVAASRLARATFRATSWLARLPWSLRPIAAWTPAASTPAASVTAASGVPVTRAEPATSRQLRASDPPRSFVEALARIGSAVGGEHHGAHHVGQAQGWIQERADHASASSNTGTTSVIAPASTSIRRPPIEPFTSAVPGWVLDDLLMRLWRTRWPDQVEGTPWEDGTDQRFLRSLVRHWLHDYDWRAAESRINALPNYLATVGGTRIHFVHVRGRGPSPMPLVLTHGWPGSFLEYSKIIPRLTDPERYGGDPRDAFDVIIPSLPGYGFSRKPTEPGMHAERIASIWAELMTGVLGYERFAAHGSDIGASVTSLLGLLVPERLFGIHLTSVTGSSIERWLGDGASPLSDAEMRFCADHERWKEAEGGYSHLQRTKPQSLAHALTDSPVGLAAWIVEKYRAWSDCDGDIQRRFTIDELLTTITLYWVTETIGPSMRLYYEGRKHPRRLRPGERVEVPCGVALFPKDITHPPLEWGERAYRITRWTEMPRGGHFPAHEEPELLADDIATFFRSMRS